MTRDGYFHGDLRRAMCEAGLDAARSTGPEAISLRELARTVHVSPSAAYRHFDDLDDLVTTVAKRAQARIATAMQASEEATLAALPADASDADRAMARLHSVGRSYIRFAWDEPGWFLTAFKAHRDLEASTADDAAGPDGRTPFMHLSSALDAIADAGLVSPEARAGAEVLAWSTVHGFATLTVEGPLRALDQASRDALAERVVQLASVGIMSPGAQTTGR